MRLGTGEGITAGTPKKGFKLSVKGPERRSKGSIGNATPPSKKGGL